MINCCPTDWDKIFEKDTSDKELLFITSKELLKLKNKKQTNKQSIFLKKVQRP